MLRPDASRVIAAMKHARRFVWNRTMRQHPGYAMGCSAYALAVAENTVAAMIARPCPFPASIRLPNVTPETFGEIEINLRRRVVQEFQVLSAEFERVVERHQRSSSVSTVSTRGSSSGTMCHSVNVSRLMSYERYDVGVSGSSVDQSKVFARDSET